MRLGPADDGWVEEVVRVVKGGGLVIFPTETLYGIGCDPFNRSAVDRVRALKGRDGKPFPVLVSGIAGARRLVRIGCTARLLMGDFWPGALTLVLEARAAASRLGEGTGKIGVRMPNHPTALRIIDASGGTLVGTSANLTGQPPARSVGELDPRIEGGVDLVVDGGPSDLGLASTVVEVVERRGGGRITAKVKVLREGALGIDAIKGRIPQWRLEGVEVEVV